MELPSAGLPFVNISTRPARLKPMAARRPATPLPISRKSTDGSTSRVRLPIILAPARPLMLYPSSGHPKGNVAVHRAQGEILVAHEFQNRVAPLPERLIFIPFLPL